MKRMKDRKSNLDERQEQQLLQIEHRGCWLAFWGLFAAIVVEQAVFGYELRAIAGEWIVFIVLAVYLCAACARNGIWDRHLKMDERTNLVISLIAGAAAAAVVFAATLARYQAPVGSLAAAAMSGVAVFALVLLTLTLAARYTRRRQKRLEREPEEDTFS